MSHPPPPGDPGPTQPDASQPFPVHPNAHQWPAYRPPPPKPEKPLRAPLVWAALFSVVGVLLFVLALLFLLFLCYAAIWLFIASISGEAWSFWGALSEVRWVDAVLGPVGAFIVVATVVVFALCTGALLLLRLADGFRRWPAPLQGLTAAGITYAVAAVVLPVISEIASAISGGWS